MLGELHPEVAHRVRGGLALDGHVVYELLGDAIEVEPIGLRELEPEPLVEPLYGVRERRGFGLVAAAGPVVDRHDDTPVRL